MRIGAYTLTIIIPTSQSLKEKRRVVRSIKDRLRSKYNISVAEIDGQDLWQRSTLAIVSVSNDEAILSNTFSRIRGEVESIIPGHIVDEQIEFLY